MTKRSRLAHLTQTPEEARAENLRVWAATIPDRVPIDTVEPRARCKVAGVIQNIRIDPREGSGSIEATIIDGTGQLVARWLGRKELAGIRLGTGVVVEGVVGKTSEGEGLILNPEYSLIPSPENEAHR